MFSVIPAPYPNYPSPATDARPVTDFTNRLETLKDDEYQLVAGEGIYQLRDSLQLGNPSAPYAEASGAQSLNPLDTRAVPPVAGTKLSLIVGLTATSKNDLKFLRPETPTSAEDASSQANSSNNDQQELGSNSSLPMFKGSDWLADTSGTNGRIPVFGHDNPALAQSITKDGEKKSRKPKNNIIKTSSTFVQKVLPADNLSKRLRDRDTDGILAFANVNRSFQWLDLITVDPVHKADPLIKILFAKAHVLCHDINRFTFHSTHIDLVMGFSTGDIIWFEPFSQKYTRLNKNGLINPHPVLEIKWMPESTNLFIAAHSDGTVVVYDKEKEDVAFNPENNDADPVSHVKPRLQVMKSVRSQYQKSNPVAYWRLSNQRINAFAFSPDGLHLAAGSEAGKLFIVQHHVERISDVFVTFFGGIQAVCWSPDGRYILFGGQDDIISIISFDEQEIVARFQGHDSWINHLAFDPWRCDGRNYRFGSVADDCKLLLWDFNASMLQRPRAASIRQRNSIASNLHEQRAYIPAHSTRETSDHDLTPGEQEFAQENEGGILHSPKGWKDVPKIPAIMEIVADNHELSWLGFQPNGIIAACAKGHIRMWDRPQETSQISANGIA